MQLHAFVDHLAPVSYTHLDVYKRQELEGAVDYPAIKLRYRQLVSQHHPDRGGSTARLQSINKAMEILQRYYSRP